MAVQAQGTTENGDSLLITTAEPYQDIENIISFEDEILGESTSCFYNKEFRWSLDGVTYSDYAELSNQNLRALVLDPNNPFYIQYRYTQVGDCELEFVSIALEVITDGGVIKKIPQIECCDSNDPSASGCQNLVIECCGEKTWNPYDVGPASQMYNVLSKVVSDTFGHCVTFFKTAADQRSKDVIFREYSLLNVIGNAEVKLLVPNNRLPTRDIQFDPMMLDFPIQFEVHIVKSEFRSVFGSDARPEVRDYLYFGLMNRMYEVDSVAEPDDFLYQGSYWRVGLVQFQDRAAVRFTDTASETKTDELVTSIDEKYHDEIEAEYEDVRKPDQYNTIGEGKNDYVRRRLDRSLIIKDDKIYNNWTMVAKYSYDLTTINRGSDAIEYQYRGGIGTSDDRSFTFWINPQWLNPTSSNVSITSLQSTAEGNLAVEISSTSFLIQEGDYVIIKGTNSYNGIHRILSKTGTLLELDTAYIDSVSTSPTLKVETGVTFMSYESDTQQQMFISYTQSYFIIKIGTTYYKYKLSEQSASFVKDNWYAVVINVSNTYKQLSLFIWESAESSGALSPNQSAELTNIYCKTDTITSITTGTTELYWRLLGADTLITNLRQFETTIEEDEQSLVLTQYVVKDSNLALLIDNAQPQLRLLKVNNPR